MTMLRTPSIVCKARRECVKLLATDGMLVKRPILVDKHRVMVGFNPVEWEPEVSQ